VCVVFQWATLAASPKGWLGVYDLASVKINSELWEKVVRKVGEQSLLYSRHSTSAWIEEVMVRRFAAWSGVSIVPFALIAMLSLC
jgi:hypothetical protein